MTGPEHYAEADACWPSPTATPGARHALAVPAPGLREDRVHVLAGVDHLRSRPHRAQRRSRWAWVVPAVPNQQRRLLPLSPYGLRS